MGPDPAGPPALQPSMRITPFASLAYRGYLYLWLTTMLTNAAMWVQQLTFAWIAYDHSGSGFITGAVLAVRTLPFLVVSLVSGVIADRMDMRRLLAVGCAAAAVTTVVFGVILSVGHLQTWHLFLFALLTGTAWAMLEPPRFALVPQVVPPELMPNGIALASVVQNLTRAIGPAIGGYLLAWFGPDVNFYIQGAFYTSAVPLILAVVLVQAQVTVSARIPFLENFRDGMCYLFHTRVLLALILNQIVFFLFLWSLLVSVLPVYTDSVLHRGPGALGLLFAAGGIGGLSGAFVIAAVRPLQGSVKVLYLAGVLAGASLCALSAASMLVTAFLSLLAMGFFQQVFSTTNQSVIQLITPQAYRGRVISVFVFTVGVSPAGSLMAGALADAVGARWAIFIGGAAMATSLLAVLLLFPALRKLTVTQ
ncbi:MAG: MFS transporter [Chloroflexi bacterium]|nr:MFS transporter [Chloroflexota bacterium]